MNEILSCVPPKCKFSIDQWLGQGWEFRATLRWLLQLQLGWQGVSCTIKRNQCFVKRLPKTAVWDTAGLKIPCCCVPKYQKALKQEDWLPLAIWKSSPGESEGTPGGGLFWRVPSLPSSFNHNIILTNVVHHRLHVKPNISRRPRWNYKARYA